jgi:hypothetical protein
VAILNVNILPEIGLYNGAIGTVVEIVYQHKPERPNDKEHNHLPDYVVVNFPNLKLPAGIPPWTGLHKTMSCMLSLLTYPHKDFFQNKKITTMPAAHTHCHDKSKLQPKGIML